MSVLYVAQFQMDWAKWGRCYLAKPSHTTLTSTPSRGTSNCGACHLVCVDLCGPPLNLSGPRLSLLSILNPAVCGIPNTLCIFWLGQSCICTLYATVHLLVSCQEYRMYTVYIEFWPTLCICDSQWARLCCFSVPCFEHL